MKAWLCSIIMFITVGLGILMNFAACAVDLENQKINKNNKNNNIRGWLELNNKQFYPEYTAKEKVKPYVSGVMTDKGFVPDKELNFNLEDK